LAQYNEGQRLQGSDGHVYVVRNGTPVRADAQAVTGGNPKLPGELTGQGLNNQGQSLSNQKNSATLPFEVRSARAAAEKAEIDAKNAKEQYDSAHPQASTSGLYGPDYLKTLSASDQNMVKALSEGRLAFPQGAALRAPFWQEKISQVAQFDPTFDATNFNARAKGRANAISGRLGQSNNALNTALGHLQTLSDQIGGTASHGGFPFATSVNAVENAYLRGRGDSGVTNFADTASKLADELEAVYRNGGGAEQGVTRQLRNLDPNMSREQKVGVIHNAMDLLASKMAANLSQYDFGTGGKPTWDMLDPHARQIFDKNAPDIRDKYFAVPGHGGSGGSGGPPPVAPVDYSGMVGPQGQGPATMDPNSKLGAFQQTYRNEYDPAGAAGLTALIRKGAPYEMAAAFAQGHGFNPPPQDAYKAAVAFAAAHGGATNVEANRAVPTTLGERLATSPASAAVAGAGAGMTAGLSDVAGRAIAGDQWDANRSALSGVHPNYDMAGNVAGGALGMMGGEALLGKVAPGLVKAAGASRAAPYLPAASDGAYGAVYGASETPNDPLGGAKRGMFAGIGGGMAARGGMRGLGRVIAPEAGYAEPLYRAGVFPTIGQRAAAMGGRIGKAVSTIEQAMQSVPLLGALPAIAREGARKDFQKGAFNQALADIGDRLPKGVGPGPAAHAHTAQAFDKAYDAARSGMQFAPDPTFGTDATAFTAKLNDGTLNGEQIAQVQKRIETAVDSRLAKQPVLGGEAYKNAASELARTRDAWAKSDPLKADALGDYITIFDNAARRGSDPHAAAMLDQADSGYAKFVRIQRASERGGVGKDAGTFSPVDYAGAVKQMGGGMRSNAYNRGNALGQDYAQAGLALRDTLPNSGTPERLMAGQVLGGGAIGGAAALGGAHALANPITAGMFGAYAPGVQNIIKHAIAPNEYRLPALADPLNLVGHGVYDRAGAVGRLGAPAALGYFSGQ
jgi:hypothetical protein